MAVELSRQQNSIPPSLVCIMGPTAAGKTGLAVDLVERFPLDIVSVDSALVYRGMNIGTARPDAQTLRKAPHRLIGICDPQEVYSAARFCTDAAHEIQQINSAGRVPLLVGGTMLYFRALLEGLSALPVADSHIRAQLDQEREQKGLSAMHAELARLDPEAAVRINPNDPQRIQRALEVFRITGQPISKLQTGSESGKSHYKTLKIIVCPQDRQVLHQRIEQRFKNMLDDGLVAEVKALHQQAGLNVNLPAMRAVGYRQCLQWLNGELNESEWQQKAIVATRQLAKRQLTWLRREEHALWYHLDTEESFEKVFSAVREFLVSHC